MSDSRGRPQHGGRRHRNRPAPPVRDARMPSGRPVDAARRSRRRPRPAGNIGLVIALVLLRDRRMITAGDRFATASNLVTMLPWPS